MKHLMLKASCGVLALFCGQAVLADPHHADPIGVAVCDDSGEWYIEYSAMTWIQPPTEQNCLDQGFKDKNSCGNPLIGIFTYDNEIDSTGEKAPIPPGDRELPIIECFVDGDLSANAQDVGALESATNYTFMGRFLSPFQTPGDTFWLATKPLANWTDGRTYACVNSDLYRDYRDTTVTIPDEPCEPAREFAGLTPGFWGNSSSCTNGNQFKQATKQFNNGDDPRRITLDENLPQTVGDLVIAGDSTGSPYDGTNDADCETGVRILNSRTVDEGENSSNDAAYKLARSQLAYLLNTSGAQPSYDCPLAQEASEDAQTLLASIGFDGTGDYLVDPSSLREEALALNDILDLYNNNDLGDLCD